MQDIDFLPAQYHRQHASRQSQPWRIVVVAAFVALLGGAIFAQYRLERGVEDELAAIAPQHDLAVAQNDRLTEFQSQLKAKHDTAALYTYLRHPWPRTQLLAALIAPLPDEIDFRQVQITRGEKPQEAEPTERRSRSETKAEEEKDKLLPPAERDLKRLRQQYDKMQTLILLSGTASESAALHRYLGALGAGSLFAKVELDSIESVATGQSNQLEFHATLIVRPGYGQADGPSGPPKNALAQTRPGTAPEALPEAVQETR
ncbi:MAG TPA: hypothetical protein VMY42_01065 [Thermoguttaceae bacterium]|nr:hypothetical protein [Thermoguttaceae bacterium]